MEEHGLMGACEMNSALYVCVYIPEFPAQALIRLRPKLAHAPLIVLSGDPPFEQVCSLNRQAGRLGVCHGMTRAELDSFTGLSILRRSEAEERSARAAVLEAAAAFTPRVEVQPSSLSTLFVVLDMTGTSRMFGPAEQSADTIAHSVRALQIHAQLAASANLQAAVCMAPSAHRSPFVIPIGQEKDYLAPLPLAALQLTPQQADTLSLWGLHTLGELAAIPEVDLVVRLGQAGERLRLLACGRCPHWMVPEEPAFVLEELIAFDEPVETMDSLLFVLGPMLDQLLTRAQNRALALASVTIEFGLDGGGKHEQTIKPALPVVQREVLLKLLHLDLQAHPPPAGVMKIHVHAEPGRRSEVQAGLFAPQSPEALRLDVTLARIAALVGEKRVGRARLVDSHRQDRFTMERFVVPATTPTAPAKSGATAALRRCRPAQTLHMQQKGRRPAGFSYHGERYVVEEAYGPWRRSGDWWSADVWSCEEWDVRAVTSAGNTLLCVIAQDMLRHRWSMEALYD